MFWKGFMSLRGDKLVKQNYNDYNRNDNILLFILRNMIEKRWFDIFEGVEEGG